MGRYLHISALLFAILSITQTNGHAQCVTINNLPDTINACKNTQFQLSPTVTATGLLSTSDTTWTPAAGLSNANIINPTVFVGTTSTSYKLTVIALTPNNFVTNGDFSAGNTGFSTSYLYSTTSGTYGLLSNEGTYVTATNANIGYVNGATTTSTIHSNFQNFPDHTGNPGGQMMVINGASVANTSIWCQTITVIPNSTYDFSAWAASATNTNPAVLQFSINGVLLGTPLTLPTTNAVWTQFHATWASGSNTSINICIVDQQTAPSGNDFVLDDIAFRQFCSTSDSVYVRVADLEPTITKTVNLGCNADTVNFTAGNTGLTTPAQYIWNFGDNTGSTLQNPSHVYPIQGQYTVKLVTKKNGCSDSATVAIDTRHPLSVGITTDHDSVCLGEAIQFNNTDAATTTPAYYWNFGDNTTATTGGPSHTYKTPGSYTVTHVITDQVPCSDTVKRLVYVSQSPLATMVVSDTSMCLGGTITFNGTATPGHDTLRWDFGDNSDVYDHYQALHSYDASGQYTASLIVGYPQCPTITLMKNITIWPFPNVNIGPDTSICPNGDPIQLHNLVFNNGVNNKWSTGETGYSINISKPDVYWLNVVNAEGCAASDSITVLNACYLDIPNAFTPNNDGNNDYFFPRQFLSSRLSMFHMQVFDRWGEKVYETSALDGRGWDGRFNGKEVPEGVYVYLIEANIDEHGIEKYQGNVTLLR